MGGNFELDGKVFNLKLGRSFDPDADVAFHSIRYDFKPASIDTSKNATLDVGEGNSVTVAVPHVEGSGQSQTIFKGNRKRSIKECVLIIDHITGEVTLEKLTYAMQVKSTRTKDATGKQKRESAALPPSQSTAAQPEKSKAPAVLPRPADESLSETKSSQDRICSSLSLSASSSSDSEMSEGGSNEDSEEESQETQPQTQTQTNVLPDKKPVYHSVLSQDLRLSESESDSD